MFKIYFIVFFLVLQARTCLGQVQQNGDTLSVEFVWDSTLPRGIAAVTICRETNPVIVSKYRNPPPEVLVHETAHVMQVLRAGGCPRGWQAITANKLALITAEAEATCIEAWWLFYNKKQDVRRTLNVALRQFHQLAAERATVFGEQWRLTPGEISQAFEAACPTETEPKHHSIYNGHIGKSGQRVYSNTSTDSTSHWAGASQRHIAED
jgi:hypothetical protein